MTVAVFCCTAHKYSNVVTQHRVASYAGTLPSSRTSPRPCSYRRLVMKGVQERYEAVIPSGTREINSSTTPNSKTAHTWNVSVSRTSAT